MGSALSISPGEERTTVSPGKDWPRIKISRKKADGCGNHGQKFLEGLALYFLSDSADLGSSLSISLSDEARRSIEAELGVNPDARPGLVHAEGVVKVVTEQLLVISLSFSVSNYSYRVYYLVYDSTDASIYMIPSIPRGFVTSFTAAPLPRFTGVGRDHELVLLARRKYLQLNNNHRVCVCAPETRASAECDDNAGPGLWQVKKRCFPELPYPFSVDEVFSFKGKLFWADLSQGLVYWDGLRSGESSAVEFSFISLPRGYVVNAHMAPERLYMGRTISCNGGCIQFICIDRHSSRPGDHMVNVWNLDLDNLQWKDQEGFPCLWNKIWRQAGFMDAEARNVVAQYPVVTPGGGLCLLLSNMPQKPGYICSFDMGNKKLLWSGTVRDYGATKSVILPRNFFTKYYPPSKEGMPHKRNLPEKTMLPRKAKCSDHSRVSQKGRY